MSTKCMTFRPTRTALGGRVRAVRIRRGFGQGELSACAGLGECTVARIELGRVRRPRAKTLRAIASVLAIPEDALLSDAGLLANRYRLTREESALVEAYRRADPGRRRGIIEAAGLDWNNCVTQTP